MIETPSSPPPRSAGVTASGAFAILGSVAALYVWGTFFLNILNVPRDEHGRHFYQNFPLAFSLMAVVPPTLIALGIGTGIGLFQLRPWARGAALVWASLALALSLSVIAFRPFETFIIPDRFVSELESLRQLLAISFVFMLLPVSVWWLFFFRRASVKRQFQPAKKGDSSAQ